MSNFRSYINSIFEKPYSSKRLDEYDLSEGKKYTLDENTIVNIYSTPKHIMDILIWPPNVFIILAGLLEKRGGYRSLISGKEGCLWLNQHVKEAKKYAEKWRNILKIPLSEINKTDLESIVSFLQKTFSYNNLNKQVDELILDQDFIIDILQVIIVADESFIPLSNKEAQKGSLYRETISQLKLTNGATSYQLSFSNDHLGTIHFKNAVCQSGISLNSISNNITYIKPEISLQVIERENTNTAKDTVNIVILPWPLVVERESFQPVADDECMLEMNKYFGFFTYSPYNNIDIESVIKAVSNAYKIIGNIDFVILPECALEHEDAINLANRLLQDSKLNNYPCPVLISGTYEKKNTGFGSNRLIMSIPPNDINSDLSDDIAPDILIQNKHHRWYLDRSQLFNYKLGSQLSPKRKWWESIEVSDRNLITYRCHKQSIQVSPLICEDLARQEPVAPIVRALGPNLIVALLLDGGQLKTRWPGRYASFLSEDPGSSVLTVSPLGMTMRADGTGFPPSRTVAFWSEPNSYKELALAKDRQGIILTLEKKQTQQWTADGRCHERISLHYAGDICF